MSKKCAVLQYAHYLTPERNSSVYDYMYFCGACSQELGKPYSFPRTPESEFNRLEGARDFRLDNGELSYFSFCPWCGTEFDRDWYKNQPVENRREPDHFKNPGTHCGDSHEFRGFTPEGHYLSSADGSPCWCDPVITPSHEGCTISHRNVERLSVKG